MDRKTLMLVMATLTLSGMAFAQTTQPTTNQPAPTHATQEKPREGSVNDRRADQQQRIGNGVQSGQLTAGETKNLESREANINREVHADRAADGGKLTAQERQQVNRQQNNVSKSIYADKHNANTAHLGNNEVGQRRENQQDRIAQGIKSGQMSAGEAARTENREQGINQQVRADRQANGGRLTGAEKGRINREQNGASRQIYRQKHNRVRAPR